MNWNNIKIESMCAWKFLFKQNNSLKCYSWTLHHNFKKKINSWTKKNWCTQYIIIAQVLWNKTKKRISSPVTTAHNISIILKDWFAINEIEIVSAKIIRIFLLYCVFSAIYKRCLKIKSVKKLVKIWYLR